MLGIPKSKSFTLEEMRSLGVGVGTEVGTGVIVGTAVGVGRGVGIFVGVGALTSAIFHFNYFKSFLIGVQMEAQGKFFFLRDPLSYGVTRLENVLEIALFFSPWLCYLLFLSIKKFKPWKRINWRNDFSGVFAAIISLAGFFFAGGYYTGETARNANYIYPFLLVMIGLFIHKKPLEKHEQVAILTLVFGQSMLMQMFGWYGW